MIKILGLEHLTASKKMEVLEGLLDVSLKDYSTYLKEGPEATRRMF